MCIILLDLHNSPLIQRSVGIIDPTGPIMMGELRDVVQVAQLLSIEGPVNPEVLMLKPFDLLIKTFIQLLDMYKLGYF